jgi:hypothetical protein
MRIHALPIAALMVAGALGAISHGTAKAESRTIPVAAAGGWSAPFSHGGWAGHGHGGAAHGYWSAPFSHGSWGAHEHHGYWSTPFSEGGW